MHLYILDMEHLRRISHVNKYVVSIVSGSSLKTGLMPLWGKRNTDLPGVWFRSSDQAICNIWDLNPNSNTYLFPTKSVEHVLVVIDGNDEKFDLKEHIVELQLIQNTYSSWHFILLNGYDGSKIPTTCSLYNITNYRVIDADKDMSKLRNYVLELSENTVKQRELEAHRRLNRFFTQ